jgi:hypothetical protein
MNGFTDKPTSTLNDDAFGVQKYTKNYKEIRTKFVVNS